MAEPDNGQPAPTDKLPLRSSQDIQGNILAPFNKPHQVFLFLSFRNDQQGARQWLRALVNENCIAANNMVANHNDQHRAAREPGASRRVTRSRCRAASAVTSWGRPAVERPKSQHWMNVGLTCSGWLTLHPELAPDLALYEAFWQGPLGERRDDDGNVTTTAALLGDEGDGAPEEWVIGGPGQRPVDAIVTIAADDGDEDEPIKKVVTTELDRATNLGLKVLSEQQGKKLLEGKDHFEFKEGVSQPGICGFTEEDPDAPGMDKAHPGSPIIAAGEFLLGQRGEQRRDPRSRPPTTPDWMRDGSFQVFRRLTQDVGAWKEAMAKESAKIKGPITPEELEAKAIGRWPSGAPLELKPIKDANLGRREINNFNYQEDLEGFKTPRFAHIRKMNPRNDEIFRDRAHRILRRGIPFFDPQETVANRRRGLLFNAYMASIEDQFEFLQRRWANDPEVPSSYLETEPAKDGPDPLIGKSAVPCRLYLKRGAGAGAEYQITAFSEVDFHGEKSGALSPPFVYTSGTVYAFAPTISALRRLARTEPMRKG